MEQKKSDNLSSKSIDISIIVLAIAIIIFMALLVSLGNMNSMIYFVGSIAAILIALTIYFQPQFGGYLLIIIAFSTFSDIVVENGYPSITKPLVVLIFVSILANSFFRQGKKINKTLSISKVEVLLFVYLLISWASVFFATNRSLAVSDIFDMIKELIIVLSIIMTLKRWEYWKRALWLILIIIFLLAVIGAIQSVFNITDFEFYGFGKIYVDYITDYENQYRISGPLDDPNFWGMVLVSVLPIGIYRILDEKKIIVKIISAVMASVILFTLLNTYSRGAFIALVISFGLIAIERKLSKSLLFTGALAILLIFSLSPSGYIERMKSLVNIVNPNDQYSLYQDSSFRGRYSELLVGFEMFVDNPVLGVGIGNFETNYLEYAKYFGIETRNEQREAHSLYLEVLAETGILGFIVFLWMMILILRELLRTRKFVNEKTNYSHLTSWISSIMISVTTYLITSIFLHGAYIRYFWIFIAMAMSINQIGRRLIKSEEKSVAYINIQE